ncbi:hypothetical protein [Anaeromyxobacter sp. PSR-1]|uniref:hypothetical protein n=1 Tax=unclassified Anaeromyxobacter TaxID=2620896 RepID=UPI0005E9F9CC|nr:hypothetical protein [Anaeromyxobacter sp. PSR-1]GAO02876.1 hypothetical protein PSR1_01752 [Anaeromyxobacter sp. PSR-1]
MRKLAVLMGALLLAGTAAADDRLGSTKQETKEAGQAAARDTKESADRAGQWTRDQTGTGSANDSTMHQNTAQAEQRRDEMSKKDFDIKGKISKVSGTSITLDRDDATTATLHCDRNTKVELDGSTARLSQLKPGQDVKASFNLKGDKPMAIEVKADSNK